MESIYWVVSRDCNQRCRHCYNNSEPGAEGLSFDEVDQVVAHLPSQFPVGRIILSGGEPLHFPDLLFHALRRLTERYAGQVPLWLQTNADLLDGDLLDRLIGAGVKQISVSSMDDFHPKSTLARRPYLEALFHSRGLVDGRDFSFWGATPDMWIGKIWPRGRALDTRSTKAGPEDDFCDRWSGAVRFLETGEEGSEVNIQLAAVYPCCPMTVRPIGDLRCESLESILDRCRTNPVYQALNRGRPEEMGVHLGISVEQALERTRQLGNCCLWCDEFFLKHYPEPAVAIPGVRRDLVPVSRILAAAS
ncbi:MAG: radical SAM protein [Bryobacteraceae bacterium]